MIVNRSAEPLGLRKPVHRSASADSYGDSGDYGDSLDLSAGARDFALGAVPGVGALYNTYQAGFGSKRSLLKALAVFPASANHLLACRFLAEGIATGDGAKLALATAGFVCSGAVGVMLSQGDW